MPGVMDAIKKTLDVVQPIRGASREVNKALTPPDPTGRKAAIAAGQTARQAAVDRGTPPVTVIDSRVRKIK